MKLWDVTLTCDHKVLVAAETGADARLIATSAASSHKRGCRVSTLPGEEPVEVPLTRGVVVWFPGPFSADAIIDEEV